jgi:hypothetical protein
MWHLRSLVKRPQTKSLIRKVCLRIFGMELVRPEVTGLIKIRTDPHFIDVLKDASFQRSIDMVRPYTLIDTARLANLWQLCRMSNPKGAILEAGVFKGGASLHLHNSAPERKVYLCDTFVGFNQLPMDRELDRRFFPRGSYDTGFAETARQAVHDLMARHTSNFELIEGCFPMSAAGRQLGGISFVHMDFDLYKSIFDSLVFLNDRMIEKSIIVVDDYMRTAEGVVEAVEKFVALTGDWIAFPIYPGQGLLIHRSWMNAPKIAAVELTNLEVQPRAPTRSRVHEA